MSKAIPHGETISVEAPPRRLALGWARRPLGQASAPLAAWRLAAPWIAFTSALTIVTYATYGYLYQVWPQFFLEYVMRYTGQLKGDWATSYPSQHWAFAHLLALLPPSSLRVVCFLLWVAGLVVLWGSFAALARALGASWAAATGAALVAVSTGFHGLGLSEPVTGFLYPTNLAFALAVGAIAALLRRRAVGLGVLLGLATLLHPDVGALGVLVIFPAFVYLERDRVRSQTVRFGVAFVVFAGAALYHVVTEQALSSSLSARQRYELLALVRAPWHYLYRVFPRYEYAQTFGWVLVLVLALALLGRGRARLALAWIAAACGAACFLGAVASEIGRPLFLVQLQTARLTSLLILIAIVAAAAVLDRRIGPWSGVALVLVPLLAPTIANGILALHHLPGVLAQLVTTSSVEAGCVAVLLLVVRRPVLRIGSPAVRGDVPRQRAVLAVVLAVTAISLIQPFQQSRAAMRSQADRDWVAVAKEAQANSHPGDVVLVPPEEDLFQLFSHRAVVATFGSFEFGQGDAEWIRRMTTITGNPRAAEPALTTDVIQRLHVLAQSYQRTVEHSRTPICRYHVKLVVAEHGTRTPPWLSLIGTTTTFALYRVAPGTCGPVV